jgi:uncharacterized protein YqkB
MTVDFTAEEKLELKSTTNPLSPRMSTLRAILK